MVCVAVTASISRHAQLGSTSFITSPCRNIKLFHAATTKFAHGNHKIKDYTNLPPYHDPKELELQLWTGDPIGSQGRMTLQDALDKYIKPGTLLAPLETKNEVKSDLLQCTLTDIVGGRSINIKPGVKGAVKLFHLHIPLRVGLFKHRMRVAYQMLKQNVPLEFHIHVSKEEEPKQFFDKLQQALYLRPDVILKAMPEMCAIIIQPQTDYREVCWVMKPPKATNVDGEKKKILPTPMNHMLKHNQDIQLNASKAGIVMSLKEERKLAKKARKEALMAMGLSLMADRKRAEDARRVAKGSVSAGRSAIPGDTITVAQIRAIIDREAAESEQKVKAVLDRIKEPATIEGTQSGGSKDVGFKLKKGRSYRTLVLPGSKISEHPSAEQKARQTKVHQGQSRWQKRGRLNSKKSTKKP